MFILALFYAKLYYSYSYDIVFISKISNKAKNKQSAVTICIQMTPCDDENGTVH